MQITRAVMASDVIAAALFVLTAVMVVSTVV